MPAIEFAYTAFPVAPTNAFPQGRFLLRPSLEAVLIATNGRRSECPVLLDSGADICAFPASLASIMGLDLTQMKSQFTGGVGTSANQTFYEDLEIDLGSGLRFKSQVAFLPGLDALGFGLLGQQGFFSAFNVCFHQSRRKFTIDTA